MTSQPDIVLVVLDTVRARSLENARTPALDRISREGIKYERAIAPAPWTPPSHAGMFTGTYTFEHDVTKDNPEFDPSQQSLAELLSARGYETIGISNNPFVSEEFGFDRGFDDFMSNNDMLFQNGLDVTDFATGSPRRYPRAILETVQHSSPVRSLANLVYYKLFRTSDTGATTSIKKLRRHLETTSGPTFSFLNLMEAHTRYEPPEPYLSQNLPEDVDKSDALDVEQFPWEYMIGDEEPTARKRAILESLYEGAIEYLDEKIDDLVSTLKKLDRWENTLLIVVGDHGESIGERDKFGHVGHLSESLQHVPFIVSPPNGHTESTRIEVPVSLRFVYELSFAR